MESPLENTSSQPRKPSPIFAVVALGAAVLLYLFGPSLARNRASSEPSRGGYIGELERDIEIANNRFAIDAFATVLLVIGMILLIRYFILKKKGDSSG